jgi:hypothetical protein
MRIWPNRLRLALYRQQLERFQNATNADEARAAFLTIERRRPAMYNLEVSFSLRAHPGQRTTSGSGSAW